MLVICPADAIFTSNSHPDTKSCSATKTENEPPTTCPMMPQRTSLAVHSHIRVWKQAQLSHGAAAHTRLTWVTMSPSGSITQIAGTAAEFSDLCPRASPSIVSG